MDNTNTYDIITDKVGVFLGAYFNTTRDTGKAIGHNLLEYISLSHQNKHPHSTGSHTLSLKYHKYHI